MAKSFYNNKKFIKLQKEWYDKLKEDGFEDLEWFNEKNGLGQGSPYLRNSSNPSTGAIRRRYTSQASNHYRLCRNFLAHGAFYQNLAERFHNSKHLRKKYADVEAWQASKTSRVPKVKYDALDYFIFSAYTDGTTLQSISNDLRELYKLDQLPKPHKPIKLTTKGEPYSIWYVKCKVDWLKSEAIKFNLEDPEGLIDWVAEKSWEDKVIDTLDAHHSGASASEAWEAGEALEVLAGVDLKNRRSS